MSTEPSMAVVSCAYCLRAFAPTKAWQRFCCSACRTNDNARRAADGMRGKVSSVRCLRRGGVSVTLQFTAIERERALKLEPGKLVGVLSDG